MKTFLLLAALLAPVSLTACESKPSQSASSVSPKEAVAKAALVLDVRTPEEFAGGHLDKAENIPVDQVDTQIDAIAAKVGGDKSKPIAVYCAAGGRAAKAKTALEKAGFTNVTNAGGYKDLK